MKTVTLHYGSVSKKFKIVEMGGTSLRLSTERVCRVGEFLSHDEADALSNNPNFLVTTVLDNMLDIFADEKI